MRIIQVATIGMLLLCFSFFSTALAGEVVKLPGVQVSDDGSVDLPGVHVGADGSVSAPGVRVNAGGQKSSARKPKSPGGKNHVVNNSDETIDLACNGEKVVINGSDNTINCHGQSAEVNINGSGNTIHFIGTCDKLILTGADNRAKMERVGAIKALGSGNRVTWVFASRGEKPNIVSTGQNNRIEQIE